MIKKRKGLNTAQWRRIRKAGMEMLEDLTESKTMVGNSSRWEVACISIVGNSGGIISDNQACHAGMSNGDYPVNPFAIVNSIQKVKVKDGEAIRYLDWLLNRSPYADTFLSKSAARVLKQQYSVSRADYPSNILVGGLIATRRLWEYEGVAELWDSLVKAGMSENMAYLVAHCGRIADGCVDWTYARSGHTSIDVFIMDGNAVKAFLKGSPVLVEDSWSSSETYRHIDKSWGLKVSLGIHETLVMMLKNYTKPPTKSNNPFPLPAEAGNNFDLKEGVNTMVSVVNEYLNKIGAGEYAS